MDDPPLAEVVAGIEGPVAVDLGILAPPSSAVDLADRAHSIQGFAGGGVGHPYGHGPWLAQSATMLANGRPLPQLIRSDGTTVERPSTGCTGRWPNDWLVSSEWVMSAYRALHTVTTSSKLGQR